MNQRAWLRCDVTAVHRDVDLAVLPDAVRPTVGVRCRGCAAPGTRPDLRALLLRRFFLPFTLALCVASVPHRYTCTTPTHALLHAHYTEDYKQSNVSKAK